MEKSLATRMKLSIVGAVTHYAGLPKEIYVLFIARIINRFGGFVHAFLALFLSMYLNMSPSQIGSYVLSAGLAGLVGTLIGGKLGDHFSRKVIYLTAQAIAAFLFIPCAVLVFYDMTLIPVFLIASSFFSAIVRPVSTAMVADLVGKEDRKRAFSLLYLGINFGVALGPLVGAMLLRDYLFWFFLGDAITTFVAVFLVGFYVKESNLTQEEIDAIPDEDGEAKEGGNLLVAFIKRPLIVVFVVFAVINSMIYAQSGFAMPLLVKEIFAEGEKFVGILYSVNAVIVLVFTSLVHYLTQKIKPIYNIAMASVLYAVGMGMMAVITSKGMFFVSIFIWTIGEIQAVTNQNVFLMRHTPINFRARFMGVISVITSLGYVLSPKLAGMLLETRSQSFLWTIVFFAGIVAAVGFVGVGLADRHTVYDDFVQEEKTAS